MRDFWRTKKRISTKEVSLWKTFFRTMKFAARAKGLFVITSVLVFILVALNLTIPYIFSLFFNYAQDYLKFGLNGIDQRFILLGIAYFATSICQTFIVSIEGYLGYKWWLATQTSVFLSTYSHMNTLSLSFFENNPTGKIRERIWNGSQAITNILDDVFYSILTQALFIIISINIIFFIQPYIAFFLMILIPIYFMVIYRFNKIQKPIRVESRTLWEGLSAQITEAIYNIKTIKSSAKEDYHYASVSKSTESAVNVELKWAKINAIAGTCYGLLIDFGKVSILIYGFYLVITGDIQIGTLILIWTYTSQSLEPMSTTVRNIVNVQKSLVDTQLLFDYLDEKPQILDASDAINKKLKHPDIFFNKVSFGYKEEETINNLTLKISGGSTLAIVGKSGSGKSTLVKLLLRLYEIDSGILTIDGLNIQKFHQKSLRDNISIVMQDSVIFNDTAINNVRYAKQSATKRDIEKAATLAGANKFIDNLPQKYDTILGEKGVKLSGGEQQRINIARAFLKDAPILILDEATSSLDSEIELEIQKSMWELAKNRTTIIIAHRLSTVMKADLIVVMDKGKIVEQGTHKDLVEHKGIYSKLFEIQSGGYLK